MPTREGFAIVVGGEQAVGSDENEGRADMDNWVHETLGAKIVDRWSSQDVFSRDLLPFVGALGVRQGVLTATGFGSWGLAHGTAAGIDIAQRIMGGRPRWESWDWNLSGRRASGMVGPVAFNSLESAKTLVRSRVAPLRGVAKRRSATESLEPGDGMVVQSAHGALAVSVGHDGIRRECSATCTHLGCLVTWNRAQQSWDCGCHGSRFAPTGEVLHGPAVSPLATTSTSDDRGPDN